MNQLKNVYNKTNRIRNGENRDADFYELVALNMDMVHLNTKMKNSTKNKLYLDTCRELLNLEGELNIYHSGLLKDNSNLCDFYMAIKSAEFLPYPEQPTYLEKLEKELFFRIFGVSNEIYLERKKNADYQYSDSEKYEYLTDLYGVWENDTKHEYFKPFALKAMEEIKENSCFHESESSNKK
ncbi:MAG: hypothetical protein IJ193_08645 [Bacilli bacterium]|nr:hypothetical protein [Bacilli bacterium]